MNNFILSTTKRTQTQFSKSLTERFFHVFETKNRTKPLKIAFVLSIAGLEALVEEIAEKDGGVGPHVRVGERERRAQVAVGVPSSEMREIPRLVVLADELRVGDEQEAVGPRRVVLGQVGEMLFVERWPAEIGEPVDEEFVVEHEECGYDGERAQRPFRMAIREHHHVRVLMVVMVVLATHRRLVGLATNF